MAKIANTCPLRGARRAIQVDQLTAAPSPFHRHFVSGKRRVAFACPLEHLKRLLEIAPRSCWRIAATCCRSAPFPSTARGQPAPRNGRSGASPPRFRYGMHSSASSATNAPSSARKPPSGLKVYPGEKLADAPSTFKHVPFKNRDLHGRYTVQVAPEDCTGCSLCVMMCPAKSDVISKRPCRHRQWPARATRTADAHPGQRALRGMPLTGGAAQTLQAGPPRREQHCVCRLQ
jgi:NAD-dependent dihydropyrimidine dehydrogenase PreA subunit